jgi:signal transduction histidine kinase
MKHSGALEAHVLLTRTAGGVRLRVSDQGCGFDVEFAKTKKRLGLISMKERLRLVGGEISIHSQPSKGTQIDVLIPVPVQRDQQESTALPRQTQNSRIVLLSRAYFLSDERRK